MKPNLLIFFPSIFILFSLLPRNVSPSYFQPCEFVECYLFPEDSSTNKGINHHQGSRGRDTVMDVMQRNGFDKMTDLLRRSGWGKNLTFTGPFTVFAITNAGFDELKSKAPAYFNTLTTDMTVAKAILADHIVENKVPRAAIKPHTSTVSLGGPIFFDSVDNGRGIVVNGSSRILKDFPASNGVVYAVTNQIVEDMFSMLSFLPANIGVNLTIVSDALQISGLSKMIDDQTDGPFTLFAPIDQAMKSMPNGKLNSLMRNPKALRKLLLNHMVPKALFIKEDKEPEAGFFKTAGGATIPFRKTADGKITVGMNEAKVIFPNRPGNNGVSHVIDQVIMFDDRKSGPIHRPPGNHFEQIFEELEAEIEDASDELWAEFEKSNFKLNLDGKIRLT